MTNKINLNNVAFVPINCLGLMCVMPTFFEFKIFLKKLNISVNAKRSCS